ncbi:HupE/UreJ family protein [Rhodococcus wratislaviensis]|uniref:HupE/UreJ family protein n=1 Tax=Rhodococcus wratislaviensis TaxID=44752 RepID=UPI0035162743
MIIPRLCKSVAGLMVVLSSIGLWLIGGTAQAHVLPTTTIELDVHAAEIDAALTIPLSDLEAASGIDLGSGSQSDVDAHSSELLDYLEDHFAPTALDGRPWAVTFDELTVGSSEDLGTGIYDTVTTTAHLVPPAGADERSFDLGYDAVIHRVVTHVVMVTVRSDWSTGTIDSPREIGTVGVDSVTGDITPLTVRLDDGSAWQGFVSMVSLGITHIREGTDHQLFLLTLLLPAPLLVAARRWGGPARPVVAVRKIAAITLAFTVGHSVTLALGTIGFPVPQQPVEVLIAISILVAAVHAIVPIFVGREALIAGMFGLVHGLAFSATLTELDLTGGQLAVSLLGFNIGIELMQLAVVAVVLPPLIVLARTRIYQPVRVTAAVLAAAAAVGWVFDRAGFPNIVADVADRLADVTPYIVATLWIAAVAVAALLVRGRVVGTAGPDAFATPPDRSHNRATLRPILQELLAAKPASEWFDIVTEARLPCAPINDVRSGIEFAERIGLEPVVAVGDGEESLPGGAT